MFARAYSFFNNLDFWDTSNVITMESMFYNSGVTPEHVKEWLSYKFVLPLGTEIDDLFKKA